MINTLKLSVVNLQKQHQGEQQLPSQLQEEYRPDLISRAVHALQSAARQRYGASPEAGFRHSSRVSKRRRKYRGCYGKGISRVNRKILSRRGTQFGWVGAFSPQTVGGRRSHPPKAEKNRELFINKKENRKALRSAMSAALNAVIARGRGHQLPAEYPFLIQSDFENINKTNLLKSVLVTLGFSDDLERASLRKVRAGIGKNRGRKYQNKKSLLIVVSENCPALKAGRNISGVDVATVQSLNVELLAPGAMPGRAVLWTDKAVAELESKKLFI